MKSFIAFLFSRIFWLNVLIAIAISFVLFWGALLFTNYYTHNGEKITVPNLNGKTIAESQKLLETKKIALKTVDSIYNRELKAGSVVEQFPRSGKEVKRGRIIEVTIAAIQPQKVQLSAVKDLSLREAISRLSKKGIQVESLHYIESEFTNLVLGMQKLDSTELQVGDEIYKGDKLVLVVGKKENDEFAVPDLIGNSKEYAKRKLLETGFNIGLIQKGKGVKKEQKNLVVSEQSEEAGVSLPLGSSIDIILTEENSKES